MSPIVIGWILVFPGESVGKAPITAQFLGLAGVELAKKHNVDIIRQDTAALKTHRHS
jgi:hypothetical protein